MECGKRVGAGVVSYPCQIDPQGHDGPCMAPENGPSVRKRTAWAAQQPRPLTEVLRDQREGYEPSTSVAGGSAPRHTPPVDRPQAGIKIPGAVEEPFEKSADRGGQPVPVHQPGGPSMHDLLMAEIEKRKSLGLSRYGTILQAGNGRNALQDLLDELIDGCVYLMQEIEERRIRDQLEALERGG